MNIDKVLNKYKFTHMPFIYYDLNNMPNLLFTRMGNNNFWKMCHFNGKKIQDVNMNLNFTNDTYYHCQPTCRVTTDGIYHVSFCIQLNGKVYLYYSESKDILNLQPKFITGCGCGCVNENYICVGYLNQKFDIYKNIPDLFNKLDDENFISNYFEDYNNLLYRIHLNMYDHNLSRINYIPGERDKLLVSWTSIYSHNHGSILIDLNNKKGYNITTSDGGPLYKSAIDPITEELYFGKKFGNGFEERKIEKISFNDVKFTEISNKRLIFEIE